MSGGPTRQGGFLGGRSRTRVSSPEEGADRLSGSDPRVRAWEDGPWPGAQVPAVPAELAVLFRHVTGRELVAHDFEILERLRAHVGYRGLTQDADPELRGAIRRALVAAGASPEEAEELPEDLGGLDDFGDVAPAPLTPDTRRG